LRSASVSRVPSPLAGAAFPADAAYRSRAWDGALLDFLLNLEYLEAEYFLRATTGAGLPEVDASGGGHPGEVHVKARPRVTFATPLIEDHAHAFAADELEHVRLLRAALRDHHLPVSARPPLDLRNSFLELGCLAGIDNFDPFAHEGNFLVGAFLLHGICLAACEEVRPMIFDRGYLEVASAGLAVEAYHVGMVSSLLSQKGSEATRLALRISAACGLSNPAVETAKDADSDALVPTSRTPRQLLDLVYGAANGSGGLFFPKGLNGVIR